MSKRALRLIAENKKTKAKTLDLGNCGLTEVPEELGDCVWLETLRLNSNKNLSDLNPLSELSQLQILDCSSTQVSDLSPLSNLIELQKLGFNSTQVSDLSPLSRLSQLQILDCSSTQVSDLSPLSRLSQLQILKYSNALGRRLAI